MSDAFFEALKNLEIHVSSPLEYRLYYDPESGQPLFYSSTSEAGTYIVVDQQTYNEGDYHIVVKDGKITKLNSIKSYKKIVPSKNGTSTRRDNVMIIAEQGQQWALKNYED